MQACRQSVQDERSAWGAFASLSLHACVIALAVFLPTATRILVPSEERVRVEIVTQRQFDAATLSANVGTPLGTEAPQPAVQDRPRVTGPAMIRAASMLSGKTLADPRSREAREILAQLADDERMVQLCNMEAMDQIHHWRQDFRPDRLVAYAKADTKISGDILQAEGAAFRSEGRWYDLKFTCELAPDHATVAAFEFLVGDAVPTDEWEIYNLPAIH